MGVLIDASVLIEHERGGRDLNDRLRGRLAEEFFLSPITASELLHGVHRARDERTRARRAAFVEAVLADFPILPVDVKVARAHALLWATLAQAGTPVGPHDTWLAGACMAYGLSLATMNVREFSRIEGLVVEDWSE